MRLMLFSVPFSRSTGWLISTRQRTVDDVCGPAAREAILKLEDGDILLLDNVRFVAEEQTLFEMKLRLTHEQQAKTLPEQTRRAAPAPP